MMRSGIKMKMNGLLVVLALPVASCFSQTLIEDTLAIRTLLDKNHLDYIAVSEVAVQEYARITQLDLSNNAISGSRKISDLTEHIGSLTSLQTLNLEGNDLTYLPVAVGKLSKLVSLDISRNNIVEIPEEIGVCTALYDLNLSENQLVNLPLAISKLQRLSSLNISGNRISVFPDSICRLSELKRLEMN
ncbi:MAG: hypothetical protein GF401_04335, partial [Chitinivibrionales bacterium]|nr:hypothetical protein [Chitinivibrionales bacterium]